MKLVPAAAILAVVAACGSFGAAPDVTTAAGVDGGSGARGDADAANDAATPDLPPLAQAKPFDGDTAGTTTFDLDHPVGANHWLTVAIATVSTTAPQPTKVQVGTAVLRPVVTSDDAIIQLDVYGIETAADIETPTVTIEWKNASSFPRAILASEWRGTFLATSAAQHPETHAVTAGPTPDVGYSNEHDFIVLGFVALALDPGPADGFFTPFIAPVIDDKGVRLIAVSLRTPDATPKEAHWSYSGSSIGASAAMVLSLP